MKELSTLDSATARGFMSAEVGCERVPTKLGGLAAPQVASKNESDDCIKDNVPLPSTASLILKTMYYWVVSRR
jgi:hypothetical protein